MCKWRKKLTSNCGIVNFWAHSQSTISQSHTFCESGKISMRNKRHKWYISWLRIYASEMCMILPSVSWIIFSSYSYHLIFVGVFSYSNCVVSYIQTNKGKNGISTSKGRGCAPTYVVAYTWWELLLELTKSCCRTYATRAPIGANKDVWACG